MKKLLLLPVFAFLPFLLNAQCGLQDSVVNVSCYNACNGYAMLIPSGASPYSYLWSPGGQTTQSVSGLCAGTYTAVMQDNNGCVATATVVITQPTQINVSVPTVPATCSSCADGSATANATGGNPPYTYNWIPQGGTNQTLTGLNPGTYSVTVTDSNGCPVGSLYTVGNSVGIKDPVSNSTFSISPNPASDVISITKTFNSPVSAVVTVTNMLGQNVMTLHSGVSEKLHSTLDISSLPAGIYYVTILSPEGKSLSRFVKN
jgi:hypothetical protein